MARSRWICPACGQRVTVHVQLSTPPVCTKHIRGGREMKHEDDLSASGEGALDQL